MDLRAILKKQGFTDDQIKAIMDEMSANKLYVSSVENPEETIRKLQEEKGKLEEDVKRQKVKKQQESPHIRVGYRAFCRICRLIQLRLFIFGNLCYNACKKAKTG